ncbi:MAG: hypothetical protein K0Q79_51 [Flavipsychrobacter sp.]|nr:hypothetical protein [Flavipsychrobacter sp.]
MGNKFQRIGGTIQGYYCYDFMQVNAEVRAYRNFKNLGPVGQYNELVTSAGLVVGYGAKLKEHNPFLSPVANQTKYINSISYCYNAYFNKIKTTQQTGIVTLQFNRLSIISENDIFARPKLDRFRTGAFLVQYQYKDLYQFAINCTMWSGQMRHSVVGDKDFPFSCYQDTTNSVYANNSHGLLSGQFKMAIGNWQTLQTNIGVDWEQVRNAVQNHMLHDVLLGPALWPKSQNCHLPVLDTEGNQYLYKPGQKIKRAQPYWNVFTSAATFY